MSARISLPLIALLMAAMAGTGFSTPNETMADTDGKTSPTSPTMTMTVPPRDGPRSSPNDVAVHPRELRDRSPLSDPSASESARPEKAIDPSELSRPDESIRSHLRRAYLVFDANTPESAADEIFRSTVLLRHQLATNAKAVEAQPAAGGPKADAKAPMTEAKQNEVLDGAPAGFGDVLSVRPAEETAKKPADAAEAPMAGEVQRQLLAEQTRRLRDAVRELEQFNLLVADGKVKAREAFKDPYGRLYKELTSYHFQLACKGIGSQPMAFEDMQWQIKSEGEAIRLAETIGDRPTEKPIMHGWTSEVERPDRTNDPAYHALQAAEYFKSWAEMLDQKIDPGTVEVLARLKETSVMPSADEIEVLPERLSEFGEKLDAHGINVPEEVKNVLKEEASAESRPMSEEDAAGDMPQ